MFEPRGFFFRCVCLLGMLACPALVLAQPANDACVDALPLADGGTSQHPEQAHTAAAPLHRAPTPPMRTTAATSTAWWMGC